jgi:hypothetical protein
MMFGWITKKYDRWTHERERLQELIDSATERDMHAVSEMVYRGRSLNEATALLDAIRSWSFGRKEMWRRELWSSQWNGLKGREQRRKHLEWHLREGLSVAEQETVLECLHLWRRHYEIALSSGDHGCVCDECMKAMRRARALQDKAWKYEKWKRDKRRRGRSNVVALSSRSKSVRPVQ